MPPRSTNAPKSAMFLTVPLRIWPDCDLGQELLLLLLAGDLDQLAAADTTMLRRLSSIFRIMHSIVLVDVVADVGGPADVDLAGGQEDVDADIDQQAALDLAGDLAA